MSDKDEVSIAKRMNPRLSDVLESVVREKGAAHAMAIERSLKTMAALAHLLELVPAGRDKRFAETLVRVCLENTTKLISIIGIDENDLHGASRASMADLEDLLRRPA